MRVWKGHTSRSHCYRRWRFGCDEIFSHVFSIIQCSIVWGNKWYLRHVRTGKDSLRAHMSNMGMNVDDARVRNRIAIIDLADLRVQLDEQGMSIESIGWAN